MANFNILNIFVHIPKTAGDRIKRNIEASLPKKNYVNAYYNYNSHYYDITQKKKLFFEGKEYFIHYMKSLTPQQKEQISCIGGHDTYYGIHEFFKKQPKYFLFFREPVARTLSLYNYEKTIHQTYLNHQGPLNLQQKSALKRNNENFLIHQQVPTFEEWLINAYDKKIPFYYSMTQYLEYLGFIENGKNESSLLEGLKKFHFIGITELWNEDSLFLYHELGVNKFGADPHASIPHVKLKNLDPNIVKKIKEMNETDLFLYEAAKSQNNLFKSQNTYFQTSIEKTKKRQRSYMFKQHITNSILDLFNFFWAPLKKWLKLWPFCVNLNKKIKQLYVSQD